MKLSILTTLYNSSSTVDEFCRRAVNAAEAVTQDFEIVLVDHGSPDDSLDIACHLGQEDCRVRVVELSRNFGHHKALMTGLDHAAGDLCFLIDSGLEENPCC
jgi:putative glycosyltransferase